MAGGIKRPRIAERCHARSPADRRVEGIRLTGRMLMSRSTEQAQAAGKTGTPPRARAHGRAPAARHGSTAFLQRQLGNRAYGAARAPVLQRACACGGTCPRCRAEEEGRSRLQRKLRIGAPGDRYEREADRVAAQVVRAPGPEVPGARPAPPSIQRLPLGAPAGGETDLALPRDGARALSPATRAFMEPRFGADFSGVRVHEGASAAGAADALGARAFTYGSDIWLGRGAGEGDRGLMAHELTHVVQQGGAAPGTAPSIQRQPAPAPAAAPSTPVRVEFNAFIPGSLGVWLPEPGSVTGCEFKTDVRGFGQVGTSRIHTEGSFVVGAGGFSSCSAAEKVGASHQRCPYLLPHIGFDTRTMQPVGYAPGSLWTEEERTARSRGSVGGQCQPCGAHFDLIGKASYPFVPVSPDIDFDIDVDVTAVGGALDVQFSGTHNMFPAYEAIVEIGGMRSLVYTYMPTDTGPGFINLNTATRIPGTARQAFAVPGVPASCTAPAPSRTPAPEAPAASGRRY